jgi:4'-phosphopantetheinyl transferase EntD
VFVDLLPASFRTSSAARQDCSTEIFSEELALVARAIENRRQEFMTGRKCARIALARLGVPGAAILSGQHREPLWPAGVVGSITHAGGQCAAAVGLASEYSGVGIDLEETDALEPEIADKVALHEEMTALGSMDPRRCARLVFSAKEAFYKCQFYLTRQWLNFFDLRIELKENGDFAARLLVDAGPLPRGTELGGRWKEWQGFFATAICLPRLPE